MSDMQQGAEAYAAILYNTDKQQEIRRVQSQDNQAG